MWTGCNLEIGSAKPHVRRKQAPSFPESDSAVPANNCTRSRRRQNRTGRNTTVSQRRQRQKQSTTLRACRSAISFPLATLYSAIPMIGSSRGFCTNKISNARSHSRGDTFINWLSRHLCAAQPTTLSQYHRPHVVPDCYIGLLALAATLIMDVFVLERYMNSRRPSDYRFNAS